MHQEAAKPRRESPVPAISCNNEGQQQKQQKQQTATTTTGVKRSSRFRGVSRFDIYLKSIALDMHTCMHIHASNLYIYIVYNMCLQHRHRWTGRFEAHLWDKGSWNPTQRKKGARYVHS